MFLSIVTESGLKVNLNHRRSAQWLFLMTRALSSQSIVSPIAPHLLFSIAHTTGTHSRDISPSLGNLGEPKGRVQNASRGMGKGRILVRDNSSMGLRGDRKHKCEEYKASFMDDMQHV